MQLATDTLLVYVRPNHVGDSRVIRTLMTFYLPRVRLLDIVQKSHRLLWREEFDIVRSIWDGSGFHIAARISLDQLPLHSGAQDRGQHVVRLIYAGAAVASTFTILAGIVLSHGQVEGV